VGRRLRARRAGAAARRRAQREGVAKQRFRAFGEAPGRQVGAGRVRGAALGIGAAERGAQRRPRAFEEFDLDVFQRQLRIFFEGRGELAGDGIGADLAGELGDGVGVRVLDRDVDGDQGAEGVLEGLGEVDGAEAALAGQGEIGRASCRERV